MPLISNYTAGLYISDKIIALAKFTEQSKAFKILACAVEKGDFNPQNLSGAISGLFKKTGIIARNVFVCIEFPETVIKEIEIKHVQEHLIPELLKIEIENYVPYKSENIVYGYSVCGRPMGDKQPVLIGVVNKEEYKKYISIFKKLKIRVEAIGFSSIAIANYYSYVSKQALEDFVLILSVNPKDKISVNILDKGKLRFSKLTNFSFPTTIPTAEYSDPVWDDILEEIDNAITYFQTIQLGKHPQWLCMHNSLGMLDDVKQFLLQKLNMEMLPITPVVDNDFIIPLGLAMCGFGKGQNLELTEYKKNKSIFLFLDKINIFKIFSIFILLFASFFINEFFLNTRISDINQEIYQNEQKVKHVRELKKYMQVLEKEIMLLKELDTYSVNFLDIFNEIYTFVPEGVIIKTLSINETGKVIITGISKDVPLLVSGLNNSSFLKKVNVESKKGEFFSITCYFLKGINIEEF